MTEVSLTVLHDEPSHVEKSHVNALPVIVTLAVKALKPLLKDAYQRFWRGLEELGLAFKCYEYIRMLPEAQRAIAKLIDDKVAEFREREELAKSLALLNIVYNTFPVNTEQKQESLQKLLNKTGFKLEDLAVIFEALHRQGLASRFINKPPYVIIYDVNAFKKAVIEIIEQLYSQAQQQCYGC